LQPSDADVATPLLDQDNEPVFREGWHAQVLGVANTLIKNGRISASDWTATFAGALREAEARGEGDELDGYYGAALTALETLLDSETDVSHSHVDERTELWRRAYLNTAHGQPVELEAGLREPAHDHHHHH